MKLQNAKSSPYHDSERVRIAQAAVDQARNARGDGKIARAADPSAAELVASVLRKQKLLWRWKHADHPPSDKIAALKEDIKVLQSKRDLLPGRSQSGGRGKKTDFAEEQWVSVTSTACAY